MGIKYSLQFSSALSCVQLFATPWIAARQASLSITNSRSLLRLTSIESVWCSTDDNIPFLIFVHLQDRTTGQHTDFKNFHVTSCLGSTHCRDSAIQHFSTDKEEVLGVRKTGTHNKFHFYNAVFLETAISYLTDSTIMWSRHHYFKDKETGSVILH